MIKNYKKLDLTLKYMLNNESEEGIEAIFENIILFSPLVLFCINLFFPIRLY